MVTNRTLVQWCMCAGRHGPSIRFVTLSLHESDTARDNDEIIFSMYTQKKLSAEEKNAYSSPEI